MLQSNFILGFTLRRYNKTRFESFGFDAKRIVSNYNILGFKEG